MSQSFTSDSLDAVTMRTTSGDIGQPENFSGSPETCGAYLKFARNMDSTLPTVDIISMISGVWSNICSSWKEDLVPIGELLVVDIANKQVAKIRFFF